MAQSSVSFPRAFRGQLADCVTVGGKTRAHAGLISTYPLVGFGMCQVVAASLSATLEIVDQGVEIGPCFDAAFIFRASTLPILNLEFHRFVSLCGSAACRAGELQGAGGSHGSRPSALRSAADAASTILSSMTSRVSMSSITAFVRS